MKKILLVLALLVSTAAHAEFYNVVGKSCDGKMEEVLPGERVFIDLYAFILGIGANDGRACLVLDFYAFLMTSGTNSSDGRFEVLGAFPSAVGRRSSCAEGVIEGKAPWFTNLKITNSQVVLSNTEKCEE